MLRKRRSASMFLLWCVFGAGIGGPVLGMSMPQRAIAPFFGVLEEGHDGHGGRESQRKKQV